jgi:hypothetical protein
MWRYAIAAVTLSGLFLGFGQQAQPNAQPANAVPKESLNDALRRAFSAGSGLTNPLPQMRTPTRLSGVPQNLEAQACAIPLLETRGTETNDRIAHPPSAPSIDPTMVHAPPLPACPPH